MLLFFTESYDWPGNPFERIQWATLAWYICTVGVLGETFRAAFRKLFLIGQMSVNSLEKLTSELAFGGQKHEHVIRRRCLEVNHVLYLKASFRNFLLLAKGLAVSD